MPPSHKKGPRPACVEDYDDDANTTISETRAYARNEDDPNETASPERVKSRPHRDGSDSGYSSRTGTINSEPSNGKKMSGLTIDTALPERERQPYGGVPQVKPRESVGQSTKPASRPKAPEHTQSAKEERPFCHDRGICMTCDYYGYHIELKQLQNESKRTLGDAVQPPATPSSKKSSRDLDAAEKKLRRSSSNRGARPQLYPPSATQPMQLNYASSGYTTPMTPTSAYTPKVAAFAYAQPPATPVQSAYNAPNGQGYFDQHVPEIRHDPRPPRTARRQSACEDQVVRPQREEFVRPAEKVSSKKESRPSMLKHRSSRRIDQIKPTIERIDPDQERVERLEQDKRAMPPPELTRRPSMKKASTYIDSGIDRKSDSVLEKRHSRQTTNYSQFAANTDSPRHPSPPRPPTSYWKSNEQDRARPVPHKAVSYTDPRHTKTVASNAPRREPGAPLTTMPGLDVDDKVAKAEAYQRKRSSMTSNELSAEKLKTITKSGHAPSRSDAGSNHTHRESHYSTKESTTGRSLKTSSARRNSIVIETSNASKQAIVIKTNDISISVGKGKDKAREKRKEPSQKLLEQAPNASSHTSVSRSWTTTNSSHESSDRGRDPESRLSTRTSHAINDSRPPPSPMKSSAKSSHQQSRAPSRSRVGTEIGRKRRESIISSEGVIFGG